MYVSIYVNRIPKYYFGREKHNELRIYVLCTLNQLIIFYRYMYVLKVKNFLYFSYTFTYV